MGKKGFCLTLLLATTIAIAGCDLFRSETDSTPKKTDSVEDQQRQLAEQQAAAAVNSSPIVLDKRYTTPLQGFSICPPTQTERSCDTDTPGIVTWARTINGQELVFRISLHERIFEMKDTTKKFNAISAIAGTLAVEGLAITSSSNTKLDNRDVLLISAESKEKKVFQSQAWISTAPMEYMLLKVSSPDKYRPLNEKVLATVLPTLKLLNKAQIMAMYNENMSRGIKLLGAWTDPEKNRLMERLPVGQTWYILYFNDKPVGFIATALNKAQKMKTDGFTIASIACFNRPNDKPRAFVQDIFCASTGWCERWAYMMQIGQGRDMVASSEEGFRFREEISCEIVQCTRAVRRDFSIPRIERSQDGSMKSNATSMADACLPKGMELLIPMMLDRKSPDAVSFANYQSETNNMDLATYSVGPMEKIVVNGKEIFAQKINYQKRSDADLTPIWIDDNGNVLKMSFGNDMITELASKEQVIAIFPDAQKRMDEAAHPSRADKNDQPAAGNSEIQTGTGAAPRRQNNHPQPVAPVRPIR